MRVRNLDREQVKKSWVHFAGYLLLSLVLAVGLWAYTSPEMSLHWDSIASMCGF